MGISKVPTAINTSSMNSSPGPKRRKPVNASLAALLIFVMLSGFFLLLKGLGLSGNLDASSLCMAAAGISFCLCIFNPAISSLGEENKPASGSAASSRNEKPDTLTGVDKVTEACTAEPAGMKDIRRKKTSLFWRALNAVWIIVMLILISKSLLDLNETLFGKPRPTKLVSTAPLLKTQPTVSIPDLLNQIKQQSPTNLETSPDHNSKTSTPSQQSASTPIVWKPQKHTYLEIKHIVKRRFNIEGKTEEPPQSFRMVVHLLLCPTQQSGFEFDTTLLAFDYPELSGTGGSKDQGVLDMMMRALINQTFRISLGRDNRSLTITQTDLALKRVHSQLEKELSGATAEDLDFLDAYVLGILRYHLDEAFVPLPDKPITTDESWTASFANGGRPFPVTTTRNRNYYLSDHRFSMRHEPKVIFWKGQLEMSFESDPPVKVRVNRIMDEGVVLWDTVNSRPLQVDSLTEFEFELTGSTEGPKQIGQCQSVGSVHDSILQRQSRSTSEKVRTCQPLPAYLSGCLHSANKCRPAI